MFSTALQFALKSLRAQKLRSVLTILGISIGIAVVITIMAAGRGLDKLVMSELEIYSADTISIETKIPATSKTSNENAVGQSTGIVITTLNDKDIEDIDNHPNITATYGWVVGQEVVRYQGEDKVTMIMGEGYNMPEVESFDIVSGRMFTKDEEDSLSQVVVIGHGVNERFFGDQDAVGKTVYIKNKPFRIVGVAAERGAAFFMDMDDIVIIPTKTMQKRILGIDYVRSIITKVKDRTKLSETVTELEEIIRENHEITDPDRDDFAISTMEEAANMLKSVVGGITFLLVALVCISLVVGGVGIMNIMYVSVTERTFEIGLRKSLGAKKKDILWQFLTEATVLTSIGGVVGIVLGALLALLVYLAATYFNMAWVYSIPISSIILSLTFSAAVGLFFGLYPARKAAALDPIEALRRE